MIQLRIAVAAGLIAAATVPAAAQVDAARVAELCAKRTPCALVAASAAGKDAQGRALTIVELNLGKKHPEEGNSFECRPYRREFWLLGGAAGKAKLLDLCNDGYGASGVGEDEIKIAANRLTHHQYGGSAWRWSEDTQYALSPLAVLSQESCSYHTLSPGFTLSRWNWQRFEGQGGLSLHQCGPKRADDDQREMGECELAKADHRYALIPQLEDGGGLAPTDAPALGTCAVTVDGSGKRGHLVFGKPSSAPAPWLKALIVGKRDLIVTVADTGFATGGKSWIHDDHVELWYGEMPNTTLCDEAKAALTQWGVRVADGALFKGRGNAKSSLRLVARSESNDGKLRLVTLRLALPADVQGISVVYSKAEHGRQVRLFATSALKFGDHTTLGMVYRIAKGGAICAVRNGRLDVTASGDVKALSRSE